jgi:two-component system, NarL family, sensor histidine kinase EvgS
VPRLFQEYVQGDATTAQQFGGTGLGLVICRRLALLMGGDIRLESDLGEGTTARFTASFPRGDPADIEPARPPAESRPGPRPKPNRETAIREKSLLLVVDDHPVNRTVLDQQLDQLGFHVDFASDGEDALARWADGSYALVLTDLNMPRIDGFELTRRIRDEDDARGRSRTPVIALSANVLSGVAEQCRAAGMDDFIPKPTTIPALAATLRRWLPHLSWDDGPVVPDASRDSTSPGPAILDEIAARDVKLRRSILHDFAASARADVEGLTLAVAAHDAGAVGAAGLATLAGRIENALDTAVADWVEVESDASSLRASVELLDDLVPELIDEVDDEPPDGSQEQSRRP